MIMITMMPTMMIKRPGKCSWVIYDAVMMKKMMMMMTMMTTMMNLMVMMILIRNVAERLMKLIIFNIIIFIVI